MKTDFGMSKFSIFKKETKINLKSARIFINRILTSVLKPKWFKRLTLTNSPIQFYALK